MTRSPWPTYPSAFHNHTSIFATDLPCLIRLVLLQYSIRRLSRLQRGVIHPDVRLLFVRWRIGGGGYGIDLPRGPGLIRLHDGCWSFVRWFGMCSLELWYWLVGLLIYEASRYELRVRVRDMRHLLLHVAARSSTVGGIKITCTVIEELAPTGFVCFLPKPGGGVGRFRRG